MKVFITGGAGFIGSHLSSYLLSQGHSVKCIDNLSTGCKSNLDLLGKYKEFDFSLGSTDDLELINKHMKNCDVAFHMAASVGVRTIMDKPLESMENNIFGTSNFLKSATKFNKRCFTFSTSEVYGKSNEIPFREENDIVLGPYSKLRWSYAGSKLMDDFLSRAYFEEHNLEVTMIRLFNTIGRRQLSSYGMVVPRFFEKAISGKSIPVYGDGTQTRCFTDVRDVVLALVSLIDAENSYGELVNIGSSEEISINQLALKIKNITNSESQIQNIPFDQVFNSNFEDFNRRVASSEKLKKITGYNLKYKLTDSLDWIYDGFCETNSSLEDLTYFPDAQLV